MNRPPASGKKGVYPPATCQELAIPFAMSAIHVRCEEARQPHRPAVMHAGSRVRRNKVRATVICAGVAQCAVAGCGLPASAPRGLQARSDAKAPALVRGLRDDLAPPSGGLGPARRASIVQNLNCVRRSVHGTHVPTHSSRMTRSCARCAPRTPVTTLRCLPHD